MKICFWGVRGSIPTPGHKTVKYGGNTSCIEIRGNNNEILIIDAGTGLRELGKHILSNDLNKGNLNINILLSHTHWDHIQGFPFFAPAFIPSTQITFFGPVSAVGKTLKTVVAGQMTYSYFPIKLSELRAKLNFKEIKESTFQVGPFHIQTCYLNHPILCLGYRIKHHDKILVTVFDNEPYRNVFLENPKNPQPESIDQESIEEAENYVAEQNQKIINFAQGADLLVYDAQYTLEEYKDKINWGHSSMEHAIQFASKAKIKKLALFHHDPDRSDQELDLLQIKLSKKIKNNEFITFFAREKLEIYL